MFCTKYLVQDKYGYYDQRGIDEFEFLTLDVKWSLKLIIRHLNLKEHLISEQYNFFKQHEKTIPVAIIFIYFSSYFSVFRFSCQLFIQIFCPNLIPFPYILPGPALHTYSNNLPFCFLIFFYYIVVWFRISSTSVFSFIQFPWSQYSSHLPFYYTQIFLLFF